jgi:hypothetical protein
MSVIGRVRKLSPFAGIAIVAGIGCSADRDVWMTQVGDYLFEFTVDASAREGRPAGTNQIMGYTVAGVDLTLGSDPLGRITRAGNSAGYDADGTPFGGGWYFEGWDRNATTDPRLPALIPSSASFDGVYYIGGPETVSATTPYHNPWLDGVIEGLTPGGVYTVAYYRYGLQVNGTLDAAQVALGEPVTEPDQLVLLGGTPAGDPTVTIMTYPTIINPIPDANPFVLGNIVATGGGFSWFDVVIRSINNVTEQAVLYTNLTATPPASAFDSALVARNDNVTTTFPRYNYLVIHEGTAATAAEVVNLPQVIRVQMGNDLDATTGQALRNANAPFPTEPMSAQALLMGTGVAGKAADMLASFHNLNRLSGAVYQAWVLNTETDAFFSPAGDWMAVVTDEDGVADTLAVVTGSRVFSPAVPLRDAVVTFRTSDEHAGQPVGDYTHIFLSIEAAEAASPSAAQPLWTRFTDMVGAPGDPFQWSFIANANMAFGMFNLGNNPWVWEPRGSGRGHFWGTGADDEFRVRFKDLNRPPVGYFYEGWLLPEAGRGAPFSIGELRAPLEDNHASLRDADISTEISTFVRSDRILDAVQIRRIGDFVGGVAAWHIAEYRLMLAPKAGAELPAYTIFGGEVPESVQNREPAAQ